MAAKTSHTIPTDLEIAYIGGWLENLSTQASAARPN